jgi:hypothetical protein
MSKVVCAFCNKTLGYNIGLGFHPNGGDMQKSFDGKWCCNSICTRDYNRAFQNTRTSNSSSSPKISNEETFKSPEQIEAEARAQAIEAQQSLERRRYEEELAANKRAERNRRADELRKQGKNFQAFCVEFQNLLIGVLIGLIFIVGAIIVVTNDSNQQDEANIINTQLEQREDSIKLFISNKEFDKALELTQKLNHPMHVEYKAKTSLFATYYDEYWSEKRESYKELIFNKGKDVKGPESDRSEDIESQDDSYSSEEENTVLPEYQQYEDQYVDSTNF